MPRFFVESDFIENNNYVRITGDDARHISRSLRMAAGESITVCDMQGNDYLCVLDTFCDSYVGAKIISQSKANSEPPFYAHLFQALPKGEKLEYIIQKSVECGIGEITTFASEFCIAKDKGDDTQKLVRRRRIALEAAKQSGRGIVPKVNPTVSFAKMIELAKDYDLVLFCYERAGESTLKELLRKVRDTHGNTLKIAIIIGSEGGFSENEAILAKENGMSLIGLGKRILRTETASSFLLGALVYELEL